MRRISLLAISISLLLLVVGVSVAAAQPTRTFVAFANLSGGDEVPPVTATTGGGLAVYRLDADGLTLHYTLVAVGLTTNPVAAHIHGPAAPGTNAGVVAFLFPANANSVCTSMSRFALRCHGVITAANLQGSLLNQPLSALLNQMTAGNSYTNVHTTRFPGGEVRGQNDVRVDVRRGS